MALHLRVFVAYSFTFHCLCCCPVQAFYSVTNNRRWNWETYQFMSAAEAIFSRWIREQERKTRELQHQQLAAMSERLHHALRIKLQSDPTGIMSLLIFGHPDLCEMAGADTFTLVCNDQWMRVGAPPPQSWLNEFATWFADQAEDQRRSTRVEHWKALKVWSTVNLSHDYRTTHTLKPSATAEHACGS